MNKFEQLIEYVINDEDQKARELFHDIVVAKSREIYENLMQEEAEEDLDEAKDEEELDEAAEEEELDEAAEEDLDEGTMGGDASDDLIDEIEADEEQDMSMEAEGDDEMGDDEGGDFGGDDMGGDDMGGSDEPATKDDVMNLEDKLDELMAEFEGLMGGGDDMGDGDGFGPDEGGDAIGMDDTGEMEPGMMEAISLKAAPKPVTAEQGNGKAGPVAFNSGAAGMASKPVHTGTSMGGVHDSSAYRNTVKELGVTPTQDAGKKAFKSAAPAPVKSQASGVNTKSPLPSGRKG
jgi:hypothetical protein